MYLYELCFISTHNMNYVVVFSIEAIQVSESAYDALRQFYTMFVKWLCEIF